MAQGFMKDFLVIQDELSDTDLDTRIRVEAIGDEDTIRVDVGDNISGYPAIPDVLLISAAQFTLDLGAADVAATAGAPIRFKAGDGNTTGDGGDITFEAGVSAGGSAGAVILPDQVAPSVTTNKLYAVAGNIFWNGLDLAAMADASSITDADGDTRIRTEVTADADTIVFDLGDGITGFPGLSGALVFNAEQFTLGLPDANVPGQPGADIDFSGSRGNTTGRGGNINWTAKRGGSTAIGGSLNFTAGDGGTTSGDGGNITFTAGSPIGSGNDGTINLNSEVLASGDITVGLHLLLPSFNDAATPSLAFGDGDTGFYELADDVLNVAVAGTERFQFTANQFQAVTINGGAIYNENASATNPTLIPNKASTATGIGANSGDQLSIICGGVEGKSYTEVSNFIIEAASTPQTGLTAFATGGQASATQILCSFATITTCATGGDSVKLPVIMRLGSHMTIKNDGAAACDVFPGSGNDLGAGTDTAVSIAPGAAVIFLATVADATWTQIL